MTKIEFEDFLVGTIAVSGIGAVSILLYLAVINIDLLLILKYILGTVAGVLLLGLLIYLIGLIGTLIRTTLGWK